MFEEENAQWGTSIDWTLSGAAGFYANLYQTKNHGTGCIFPLSS